MMTSQPPILPLMAIFSPHDHPIRNKPRFPSPPFVTDQILDIRSAQHTLHRCDCISIHAPFAGGDIDHESVD